MEALFLTVYSKLSYLVEKRLENAYCERNTNKLLNIHRGYPESTLRFHSLMRLLKQNPKKFFIRWLFFPVPAGTTKQKKVLTSVAKENVKSRTDKRQRLSFWDQSMWTSSPSLET